MLKIDESISWLGIVFYATPPPKGNFSHLKEHL